MLGLLKGGDGEGNACRFNGPFLPPSGIALCGGRGERQGRLESSIYLRRCEEEGGGAMGDVEGNTQHPGGQELASSLDKYIFLGILK